MAQQLAAAAPDADAVAAQVRGEAEQHLEAHAEELKEARRITTEEPPDPGPGETGGPLA